MSSLPPKHLLVGIKPAVAKTGARVSADTIAMILSEELTVKNGRIEGIAYVAVKLAGMAERGELQPTNN